MNLQRFKKQQVAVLAKRQPDLLTTLKHVFPEFAEDEDLLGRMAGLHIEYVIQSGGNVDIFAEDVFIVDDEEDSEEF